MTVTEKIAEARRLRDAALAAIPANASAAYTAARLVGIARDYDRDYDAAVDGE